MAKPRRAAARVKASSEISPRRLVVSSRSNGVWERSMGRAWAGRGLRPREARLRLDIGRDSGQKLEPKRKRRKADGPAPTFIYFCINPITLARGAGTFSPTLFNHLDIESLGSVGGWLAFPQALL